MKLPSAVLISDIHFTPNTLNLATEALVAAQAKARVLDVPLIICGDTLDTKAVMRAECVNRLIDLFRNVSSPPTIVLVGNHDLINEKSAEHSLQFLAPYVHVIDRTATITLPGRLQVQLIPYHSDTAELKSVLEDNETPRYIIMHQGVQGANLGHYVKDATSLPPETFDGFRVYSGHYHAAQDIKCGKTGLFTYIGNPYTLTFGEANDPPKGYAVLYSDGSIERIPLNLRAHRIYVLHISSFDDPGFELSPAPKPGDLIWLKISGPASALATLDKQSLGHKLFGHSNFKLDLSPDASPESLPITFVVQNKDELFDALIDMLSEPEDYKTFLKSTWRELL